MNLGDGIITPEKAVDRIEQLLKELEELPVTDTPGSIITIRNDKKFPLSNTGLCFMGYRDPNNTWELEVKPNEAIGRIIDVFRRDKA